MNKKLYLILIAGLKIIDSFLQDKTTGQEFLYKFADWYYFNKITPQNKIEEKIHDALTDYGPDIMGWYQPDKNIRETTPHMKNLLWDDKKTKEELINLKTKLLKYIPNETFNLSLKKDINPKLEDYLEYLILSINRCIFWNCPSWHIEREKLLKIISDINKKLIPKTQPEKEIKKYISDNLKLLNYHLAHEKKLGFFERTFPRLYVTLFPPKEDPTTERDPFIDTANDLKREVYYYLNPAFKE